MIHTNEKIPGNLNGRSIFMRVIPTVCNLKNMLYRLREKQGDKRQLKSWEKNCYKAYCIDEIKNKILSQDENNWSQTMCEYILTKEITEFGANVVDIYLVAFVAENYGVGKKQFLQYVLEKGISEKANAIQAIWQVGRGDGVYLGILNEDGSVKDWAFINAWLKRSQLYVESSQLNIKEKSFDIFKWCEKYDYSKYPTAIYDELIVEGMLQAKTMLVMGAWKTGSIARKAGGTDYKDKNGNMYAFQEGWEQKLRVHYVGWKYMMDHFEELKEKVPKVFPDNIPDVMEELMRQPGIGFVYASFFLHCCNPEVFPLYDQHIYRAYRYEVTRSKNLPEIASADWKEYKAYKEYFSMSCANHGVEYKIMDRALWAYGKWLKERMIIR